MNIRTLTRRVLPGFSLIGVPVVAICANSPHAVAWVLLANANILLLVTVCCLLFAIRYS